MGDKIIPIGDGKSFKRLKDMGDGTHAEVVSVTGVRTHDRILPNGSPIGILKYANTAGKMVSDFGGTAWAASTGAPALVRDWTGYDVSGTPTGVISRTGIPKMLKWPVAATSERIALAAGAINVPCAGKIGIWVYVENMAGYGPGETLVNGNIMIELSTNAAGYGQCYTVTWNSNQLREGWNFLKFVAATTMTAATIAGDANVGINGEANGTSYCGPHPFGMITGPFGDGSNGNIVANNLRGMAITASNLVGCTLYFDSIWTGFAGKAVFVPMIDQLTSDVLTEVLPIMQANGWQITAMAPRDVWVSGATIGGNYGDLTYEYAAGAAVYQAGWDIINHTMSHRRLGDMTAPEDIHYEVEFARAWNCGQGYRRGSEFYASPQSSSSRLSDKIIEAAGFKLQRHARKVNVSVTPWGVDNLNQIGAMDLGNQTTGQKASKIKKCIDTICRYGDAFFPFWHFCRVLGDPATGEGVYTSDNLQIYKTNLQQVFDYMAVKIQNGEAYGVISTSQFYYGI